MLEWGNLAGFRHIVRGIFVCMIVRTWPSVGAPFETAEMNPAEEFGNWSGVECR